MVLNQMVEHAYRFQDMMLARTLELIDEIQLLLLCLITVESGAKEELNVNYFAEAALITHLECLLPVQT